MPTNEERAIEYMERAEKTTSWVQIAYAAVHALLAIADAITHAGASITLAINNRPERG